VATWNLLSKELKTMTNNDFHPATLAGLLAVAAAFFTPVTASAASRAAISATTTDN
jgi:hypothetical protein